MTLPLTGDGFDYAPFYCEENVWRLLADPGLQGREAWAVAVFSPGGPVPVRRQRLGQGPEGLVLWDYHVFCVLRDGDGARILDFDTTLGFSAEASSYLRTAFPAEEGGSPLFRVMEGAEYRRRLASDRKHMLRADGSWIAPPPAWEHPAGCGEGSWELDGMLSDSAQGPGRLMDRYAFGSFLEGLDAGRREDAKPEGPEAEGPEAEGPEAEGPEAEGPEAEGPEAEGTGKAAGTESGHEEKAEHRARHRHLRLLVVRRLARALLAYFICMFTMTLVLDTSLQATMEAQIIEGVNAYMSSGAAAKSPDSPAEIRAAMIDGLRKSYGLDRPIVLRALIRTWDIVTFRLGKAGDLLNRSAAARQVLEALGNTLILLGISTCIALSLGIILGMAMARRPGSPLDKGASLATMLFFGTPAWWMGTILIMLFVYRFPVFPFGAVASVPAPEGLVPRLLDRASYLVLPVLSIAFIRTWGIAYMTRTILLPQLHEDYVMAARGRGIRERRVLRGHVMGTAMPGIATTATQYVVAILGGDIVVENVFAYRGIGYLFWYSVRFNRTVTAVLSLAVLVAMTCLAYALLDIAYTYLDPRIRRPGSRASRNQA